MSDGIGTAVCETVRARRVRLGMTQGELAERLRSHGWQVDPTGVSRIEAGCRDLRLSEIAALANALGTSTAGLLAPLMSETDVFRMGYDFGLRTASRAIEDIARGGTS